MTQKLDRDYQRAQCVALSKTHMTCREMTTFVDMSKSSVHRALKRFEELGDFHDRRCSGRPKKLNNRNIRMLRRLVQDNRYSAREITIRLNNQLINPVCVRTVTNYLHNCSYEYKTKITKPFLNKNHQQVRLNWCLD